MGYRLSQTGLKQNITMKPTDDNWWSWSQVCRALIRPKQIRSDITPHSFCPSPTRAWTTAALWGLSLIKNRNFHLKKKKSKHVFASWRVSSHHFFFPYSKSLSLALCLVRDRFSTVSQKIGKNPTSINLVVWVSQSPGWARAENQSSTGELA